MKRFLYQVGAFCIIVLICTVWGFSLADGNTDPYYVRFTTPKQNSLILGTSRAAQGLQPKVLSVKLGRDIYNYSFTMGHSPYGPTYLRSVERKLLKTNKNGVFIVTVDPWSISATGSDPNDSSRFEEQDLCLGNTSIVDMKPNFLYLFKNLGGKYYRLLHPGRNGMYLHDDGWLEVSAAMDKAAVKRRLTNKLKEYREGNLPRYKFSSTRFEYLKKTIQLLNQYGKVYLIRLPIHPEVYKIELESMPDFDKKIRAIAPLTQGYYDMTFQNADFTYTDGNHLYKESGKLVSMRVADWIIKTRLQGAASLNMNR